MRVEVTRLGSDTDIYTEISAVGVGHIRKDLVLVPSDPSQKPIEVAPEAWDRLVIDKLSL